MPIDFACSGCGERLLAKDAAAGRIIACPACGKATTIPSTDGLTTADRRSLLARVSMLEEAEASLAAEPSRKSRRTFLASATRNLAGEMERLGLVCIQSEATFFVRDGPTVTRYGEVPDIARRLEDPAP